MTSPAGGHASPVADRTCPAKSHAQPHGPRLPRRRSASSSAGTPAPIPAPLASRRRPRHQRSKRRRSARTCPGCGLHGGRSAGRCSRRAPTRACCPHRHGSPAIVQTCRPSGRRSPRPTTLARAVVMHVNTAMISARKQRRPSPYAHGIQGAVNQLGGWPRVRESARPFLQLLQFPARVGTFSRDSQREFSGRRCRPRKGLACPEECDFWSLCSPAGFSGTSPRTAAARI